MIRPVSADLLPPDGKVERIAFRVDPSPLIARLIGLVVKAEGSKDRRVVEHDRSMWVDMLYRVRREPYAASYIGLCESCPGAFYVKSANRTRCLRCTRTTQ